MDRRIFCITNILVIIFTVTFVGASSVKGVTNPLGQAHKGYSTNNRKLYSEPKSSKVGGFPTAPGTIPNNENSNPNICLTEECIHTASAVLKNMNRSVNPCDNFYQFACGNYIKNTKTPSNSFRILERDLQYDLQYDFEQPLNANDSKPIRLVKTFYKLCMNVSQIEDNGLTYVKSVLKDVGGGWPVLEKNWDESGFNWIETIEKLSKSGLAKLSFVPIFIGLDVKNSSQRRIFISDVSTLLPRQILNAGRKDPIVNAYYTFMVDIAEMLGADKKYAEQELDEVVEFESRLANITLTGKQRRNETALYNPITISKLEETNPFIPWLTHLNSLLLNQTRVLEDTVVIVESFEFLKNIEDLLQRTSKRTQANYLLWIITYSTLPRLTDAMRRRKFEFIKLLSGQSVEPPRWMECISETKTWMNLAVSALYIQKHFNRVNRENVVEMVTSIQSQFESRLHQIHWMDMKTKQRALDKMRKMRAYTGYPDELLDNDILADFYKDLDINDSNYLETIMNFSLFYARTLYKHIDEAVDQTDWKRHGLVATINALYDFQDNSIQIPAGILQGKFFNAKRPRYMNYGAIGSVIAHEIVHAFDNSGKKYDENGDLVNWWEPETEKSFSERAQCIINQYGNYTVTELNNTHLNGINTQGENIADNGGVKVAYAAYQDWVKRNGPELILPALQYTANQLFWISMANTWCSKYRPEDVQFMILYDTHSPANFRINGPFRNADEFSKDFHCPVGSPMNPSEKCTIW